ncbi:BTAD domain-containing putative transcriptional regulator [Streptomyces sp. NBS 14/10]|nr:BTAD domain-containing putative transcriptional regulator [Streptomyces sp. NBS 14/10]KAK1184687.1 BTAD domain-containing putative transcriptional regulator [Streptomyces sp. NBS 14/10]
MRGTAFSRACAERQWARPAVFLMVYATVAARLGEPAEVTARQFHRWRQPGPPCPQPSAQRVLEEMFGTPLHHLGFDLPEHRRRDTAAPPVAAAEPPPAALRFAVLGPVRVRRGDEPLAAGRPQERALLCALLMRRGHTATAQELMDAVWGGKPPRRALATLRTYAFQLRKTLGPRALVSDSGGYALHMPPEALDLVVCEGYEAQARIARAAGELPRARTLLHKALDLWDGEPLGGVPGPYAQAQRARLTEWRLTLLQTRLELDLELGHHTAAIAELTALSFEYPLRERLRALQMLALYRGGRQAEALRVYTDTRRLLAEELGVDPGPELTELYQNVLCASPALARPTAPRRRPPAKDTVPYASPRPAPPPAQLPAESADFTGRAALVHRLAEQLPRAQGAVMPVLAVRGLGGVGKTALALRVAHTVRGHFPDGQLYADLLGHGAGPADPGAVLAAFLRALGVPAAAVPEGTPERAALYRSTLAGRRVLVLLDNAHDGPQIRPLLPGAPGCAALVTSRARLADLDGARPLDLDVMTPDEALTLFTRAIGEERAEAEPVACRETVAACGFLPLAIRIAAARLSARPAWTIAALAARLADERGRLDELRIGDLTVASCFASAYRRLRPDQARAFRLLALADGPDLSLPVAAALLGRDRRDPDVEPLLDSLVDSGLLESPAPGHYRYRALIRLYARRRADTEAEADVAGGDGGDQLLTATPLKNV